mmetsp:Transcript_59510/g.145780  ORF Transcript_59510/g.145780 Transcript_59510/m.145780 type:complete len:228 (+) Transcript_59510:2883-3566(+)
MWYERPPVYSPGKTLFFYTFKWNAYLRSLPRIADPANEATPAAPRAPTAKVCVATSTTVSSGMRTTAPTAPANDANPAALRTPGGTVTADASKGRAPGANSTTLGRIGRTSGVAASTRTRMSLFSAARARRGSNFDNDKPASCALERSPDCATFVKRPDASTSIRSFLTAMLFPTESTSSASAALRATVAVLCGTLVLTGANAVAVTATRATRVTMKGGEGSVRHGT